MKEFISNADFNRVLEILGLPGETLEIVIGDRNDAESMAGVASSWYMRAVIGDQRGLPYSVRVVYVPVFLPVDQERYDAPRESLTNDVHCYDKL